MKAFMDEEFLLETKVASKLYHEYAEKTPILDYHCHISPREIYEDRGESDKAGEYARFVTQNTPPEFGTKADEWRFTSLFQEYLQDGTENGGKERKL